MLASDLAASQRRLAERAKAAAEKAKSKAEKERILLERQRARQAAIEEDVRQKRLEQLRRAEEVSAPDDQRMTECMFS